MKIIRNAFLVAHISMFINTTNIFSVAAFAAAKVELSSCDYMAYKA